MKGLKIMEVNSSRRGEKIGWTVGWIGGFLWIVILSIIFYIKASYQKEW